jgi:hypothetical protein
MTPPVLKYFAIKIKNAQTCLRTPKGYANAPTYQCIPKGCAASGTIQAR